MPPTTEQTLEGLRLVQDQPMAPGWKAVIQSGINEIERLLPYVEAFRREEARADGAGTKIDDLTEALQRIVEIDHYPDATIARKALGINS